VGKISHSLTVGAMGPGYRKVTNRSLTSQHP